MYRFRLVSLFVYLFVSTLLAAQEPWLDQGGDQKERRKNLEDYVKNEYASDRLVRFENTNARDFSAPFKLTVEAAEARRGFTGLYHADLHVTIYNILYRLPDYLLKDPAEAEGQEDKLISERDKKKRQHEFVFDHPYVTEWQYRIHPPPGFVVRAVPEDQVERFGPATLTTRFSRDLKDGVLVGSFVFDSGKRRWSAGEVEEFRDALKKWKKVDNPQISFSLKGTMLLQAGKVREGLDELKRLSALHPKESLHHVQIAYSLLEAGLGSSARAEARLATQLEPTSAEAHRALGWILQHDLVGRRRKKGFDLAGAVAAYRKALELDPKNNEIRLDYAILLEYDARGTRYSAGADLAEALKQYEAIGEKLSEYNAVDNPLYTRLYLRKYDELIKELNKIQRNDGRRALQITALAAGQGSAAAIAEANKLASQGGNRARVLASSAQQLINLRLYPEASDLLAAAAEGSDKAASELSRARVFRNAVRFDPSRLQPDDPANAVRLFLARLMDDSELTDEFLESFASPDLIATDPVVRRKELVRSREVVIATRNSLRRSGSDLAVLRDITMSIGQLTAESDGVDTHRVRYSTPGSRAQTFFVSRINGRLYVTGSSNSFDGVALVLLRRIAAGDLESTRKVFDWIREDVKVGGGEDELEGPVFPRLWTRGQQTNAAEARIVAAALITETRTEVSIPILEQALAGDSVPEARRPFVRLALARAYEKAARYSDLARLLPSLRTAYPDSLTVFNLSATAFQAARDFAAWEAMARQRLERFSDDVDALRSLARMEAARGNVRAATGHYSRIVEMGKPTVNDYNMLSWLELFDGNITQKGLEHGQQGNLQSRSENAPLLHTLASVYAETGKIAEAREMILKAMDQWNLDEPNSTSWYVFGRIAEQYGMIEDAAAAYKKVERPDHEWQIPNSTYQLAERRLSAIAATAAPSPAKPAAKPAPAKAAATKGAS